MSEVFVVVLGLALFAVSAGMIFVARAKNGQTVRFLPSDNVVAMYAPRQCVLVFGVVLIVRSVFG